MRLNINNNIYAITIFVYNSGNNTLYCFHSLIPSRLIFHTILCINVSAYMPSDYTADIPGIIIYMPQINYFNLFYLLSFNTLLLNFCLIIVFKKIWFSFVFFNEIFIL